MQKRAVLPAAAAAAVAISALSLVGYRAINAADHLDPPTRTDPAFDTTPDKAADIADLYVFHDANNLNLVLTFAGPQSTTLPGTYDRDVLYTINISNAGARTDAEIPIRFRYGFDAANNPGVQITGLPGNGTVTAPVETNTMTPNGIMFRTGLVDDPFFFDLQGFRESRSQGTLRFNNQRDFFAGQNDTAMILSIPLGLVRNGTNKLDFWATTARFGGNL